MSISDDARGDNASDDTVAYDSGNVLIEGDGGDELRTLIIKHHLSGQLLPWGPKWLNPCTIAEKAPLCRVVLAARDHGNDPFPFEPVDYDVVATRSSHNSDLPLPPPTARFWSNVGCDACRGADTNKQLRTSLLRACYRSEAPFVKPSIIEEHRAVFITMVHDGLYEPMSHEEAGEALDWLAEADGSTLTDNTDTTTGAVDTELLSLSEYIVNWLAGQIGSQRTRYLHLSEVLAGLLRIGVIIRRLDQIHWDIKKEEEHANSISWKFFQGACNTHTSIINCFTFT